MNMEIRVKKIEDAEIVNAIARGCEVMMELVRTHKSNLCSRYITLSGYSGCGCAQSSVLENPAVHCFTRAVIYIDYIHLTSNADDT